MRHSKPQRGFTLIEVMVVLAIISILAGIAWPLYTAQSMKGRRADAITTFSLASRDMEKCYTNNGSYVPCTPVAFFSPQGYYAIAALPVPTVETYTLTVTPVAGGPQAADADCTSFTLTSTGIQGSTGTGANCWAH